MAQPPEQFYSVVFPAGVEKIVRDARKKIKDRKRVGAHEYTPEEHGAKLVVENIRTRGLPKTCGLLSKGEIQETQAVPDLSENREALDWAAEQYFKLLLTDLSRYPEFFQDHTRCKP